MARQGLFGSSLVKKYWMALTGFFLITFLVVHAGVNAMIFWNDGGVTFNMVAHFFGTNIIIRTMEIVLFLGLIAHVVDGLMLWRQNRAARPVKYAMEKGSASRSWYSASMGILGTLILLFLIVHLWHFWVKSRGIVGSLDELPLDPEGQENLFALMVRTFENPIVVVIYVLGCVSLFWHLLHGFKSAFQSLGLNHKRYNPIIAAFGVAFSIIVPTLFALMPVSMYFGWIQ
ncbi:MAG: succinate dehydrogenase cytochrome b subunit [Flavobacteriales bacterium]|nr:succinate dehydrogenase cytochrome b subunit [Flavobacteriales bacterium]